MLDLISRVAELRSRVQAWRRVGHKIGFVPTMGNLHQGHLDLVKALDRRCDRVLVSIFVNPTQFGPGEDFANYPRTLEADCGKLAPLGVDAVFLPSVEEMYPDGPGLRTRVEVPEFSGILCGASRSGHFAGVATVVTKLLNIVQPDLAAFGKKDYQQLRVIQRLVRDLNLPVEVLAVETTREADGLAMSSRNGYLGSDERERAAGLRRTLLAAARRLQDGEPKAEVEVWGAEALDAAGFRTDYFSVRRQEDLALPAEGDRDLVILAAAHLGKARLIDNLELRLKPES